ncbi:MAG: PrpR N-terminal domain-containing protein [Clostridiales bacterium]|nr:PrpR N-terminal domain-containing protein [Clostridiales bacterium]
MKMKVLAFAPYASMRTVLREAQSGYPDLSMDIFIGTYDDYLKKITDINFYQYDCVLARGYTAKMLKSSSIIPISEIKVSLYDMLRVITMAKRRGVPFAILASSNILETAHQVMDILQYQDILTYEIESEESADAYVTQLAKRGVRLIVGDVYAVNTAQRANIPALLITSSKASIEETIQEAINNRKQHLRVYEMLNLTSELIKNHSSSILVYNSEKNVVLSNFVDMPLTLQELGKLMVKPLATLCEQETPTSGVYKLDGAVMTVQGRCLNLEHKYYAFYISVAPAPFSTASKKHIQVLYPSDEITQDIQTKSYQLPQHLLASAQAALSDKAPTVIVGEVGTCKELLAKYMWCTSRFASLPLVMIDCATVTANALEQAFSSPNSALYSSRVPLLVNHLHLLSCECQRLLCGFLEDTSFSTHNPLIVTTAESPNTLVSQGKLIFQLCDYLVGNHIHIPSLNNRTEDIPGIVDALINKYNLELGKEVIAFNADALELLCDFQWRYNINQLKSVVRQLVTSASQHYITAGQTANVLSSFESAPVPAASVDLNGSLEEIEQRICAMVLRKEHMNYSNAAKRLAISRSTLYRKLKGSFILQDGE